jgi:type IV secretory pathway VirB2 component (pilin)
MSESKENSNKERLNQSEESKEGEAQVTEEDLAVAAMRTAPEEAKLDATVEAIKTLSAQGLADLIKQLEDLPPEQRKLFLEAAARTLPAEDQKELGASLAPTQPVTDWIWKVIVGVFAFAFASTVLALCGAVLWQPGGDIQSLLTVVTTVAGILAGFISGRASTGGTAS